MFNWIANGLVITGAGILGSALLPVIQLIKQLPRGVLYRRWCVQCALIVLFIGAYFSYATLFWSANHSWHDLIVPVVFLSGVAFVWLTTTSELQTIRDIRRLSVLEQENITDPLLGIFNRRYLDYRLAAEFSKARRYGTTLAFLMQDIDYFKHINDAYGHQTGDAMLHHLGKVVLSATRNSDVAGRYGGEELMIIAPNTNMAEALVLAERIRQSIEASPLVLEAQQIPHQEINVPSSIGVAVMDIGIESSDALLRNADAALSFANRMGETVWKGANNWQIFWTPWRFTRFMMNAWILRNGLFVTRRLVL